MKKLLLLIVIINYTIGFSQESYYSDVDLELFGTDLKDALATKIKATHTRVLEYTSNGPDVWDATKETDDFVELSGDVMLLTKTLQMIFLEIIDYKILEMELLMFGTENMFFLNL
jgi:hypothetical protein